MSCCTTFVYIYIYMYLYTCICVCVCLCSVAPSRPLLQSQLSDRIRHPLIVCASYVDKAPNLAGLSRTCEIFNAEKLLIGNKKAGYTQLYILMLTAYGCNYPHCLLFVSLCTLSVSALMYIMYMCSILCIYLV